MDDVQIERRLTQFEDSLRSGLREVGTEVAGVRGEVAGMKAELQKQSGRIGKLEGWRQARERAMAFAAGVTQGRDRITKAQIAILAIAIPALTEAINIASRIWR